MQNHISRLSSIILCALLLLSLPGCWNRRELNTLAVVMAVGLDKTQESDKIQMTAQIVNPGRLKSSSSEGKSTGDKAYYNLTKSGDSLFQTIRDFTHESNRKLYFPHIQVLIFGRELTEKGIHDQLDFFLRDHETRLSIYILVTDKPILEVLEVPPGIEKIPAMHISKLVEAQKASSQTPIVDIEDFTTRLMSKTTAPIAPIIRVLEDKGKKSLVLEGTAVFKEDRCIGDLNKDETRGLLWTLNEIKSGIIDVPSPFGEENVSLEILKAESKMTPMLKDDKVIIQIDIKEEGTLGNQSDPEIYTPETLATLEQSKAEAIQNEVMAALKQARKLNADIFGFGDKVHQKYPEEWKTLEAEWEKIFPEVEVELTIDVSLRRTGRITHLPIPTKE